MDVFLTGGTGYIGAVVLEDLRAAGHAVTALARSDASAQALEAAGATVVRGELTDADVLTDAARAADAVIHTGSPGDAGSEAADATAASAFLAALAGSGKPYIHTGGIWVHGNTGGVVTESAPFAPPALTAWRLPIGERVLAGASDGIRTVLLAPGIVYGRGGGLPTMLRGAPKIDGALSFPGTGTQHWTTIHVDDIGRLYLAALGADPGTYVFAAGDEAPTVRELAEAASRGIGLGGRVVPEPPEQTADRLGPLAEALALDQQVDNARARGLGWEPTGGSLLSELEAGYSG